MSDIGGVSTEPCNNINRLSKPSSDFCIYDLDEDSLLEIFRYLDFNQLIEVSRVCTLFQQLSKRCLRRIRYFELDYRAFMENFHLPRIKDILSQVGPHLVSFKFSGGFIMDVDLKRTIVDGVALNCSNLQHLTINYVELKEEHLHALKALLSHLTGLDLGRCALEDATFGPFIADASRLTTLAIPGNAELDGSFLDVWHDCAQLEQLDISYCYSFNVWRMELFLSRAVKLRGVDVTACIWLGKDKQIFNDCGRDITLGVELPVFRYFKAA